MANPTVNTQVGKIAGTTSKDGDIAIFKGIPYAQPPLGALRWKPPQPVIPWSGTLIAEKDSPWAIQVKGEGAQEFFDLFIEGMGWGRLKTSAMKLMLRLVPSPKESEDCLYLNVRTPSLDRSAKLPVMVYVHGGGHMFGSGNDPALDSTALPQRGVVTVIINYRLGLMGYFAHPELSRESEHSVSGNYGTLDQIAALRWVRENIAAFGGDPENVTIFGESAGGESVAHLMTSPLARGLFHKAIMQSSSSPYLMSFLRHPFLTNPAGEELGQQFADRFAPSGEGQVEALRQISPEQLYQLITKEEAFMNFNPYIDGFVLEKSPFEAFRDGDLAQVPLLTGSNADEGTFLYPVFKSPLAGYKNVKPGQVAGLVNEVYGDQAEAIMDFYPGLRQGTEEAQIKFFGDNFVRANDYFYALYAARTGQPVYRYLFTRTPPSPRQTLGAYHSADIAFVHGKQMPLFDFTEEDKTLAQAMGDYWVQFARSGNPNLPSWPEWPAFTEATRQQMRLGLGSDLGATNEDDWAKLELLREYQLRLIEEMKQLRQGELAAVPA